MKIYTNVDYAGSVMDKRSTSEYCIAKEEFQVTTHDIYEGLWMKIILDDLKVKYEGPIKLLCDNNSTISIVHNPIDKHFIKEKLNSGLVVITHVPTGLKVVDVFTKELLGTPTITSEKLNWKNYRAWSALVVLWFLGQGFHDHLEK
ncbi:Copia protein, partial [Mucuna pruriens]